MGRPAKPTNLKVLHGDRSDRINRAEPVPGQSAIVPPEWLEEDALEVWHRLAPDLTDKQVLTAWDVDAFAVACDAMALYRRAARAVSDEGLTQVGMKGGDVKHPLLQVMRDSAATFATLAGRFGLTPADRARLSIGGDDVEKGAGRLLS